METGIVCLNEMYGYIRQHPEVPHRTNDREVYRPFKSIIERAVKNVPKKTGWYFWIEVGERVRPVYIGKSDNSTTWNLYTRIEEELSEEYVALWATVHDEQKMLEMFSKKYNNKYDNNHKRAVKKKGVTQVLWAAVPHPLDNTEIKFVEYKLIEFFQPTANIQRRSPPFCSTDLHEKVKNHFTCLIQKLVTSG